MITIDAFKQLTKLDQDNLLAKVLMPDTTYFR